MFWIDCNKKLPEKDGLYLVYRREKSIKIRDYHSWINNDRKRFWSMGSEDKNITHWAKLPNPPLK